VERRAGGDAPFYGFCQAVRLALDVEDLDCPVRGAGGEAATVVVEDGIVLARQWGFYQRAGCSRSCRHDLSLLLLARPAAS
jgi:hypothetical protein